MRTFECQFFSHRLVFLVLLFTFCGVCPGEYPLKPVPFNEVELTSDFWRPRFETQRKTLVPFAFERTQPGVEHLRAARDYLAGKEVEGHRPHRFIDSDLYTSKNELKAGALFRARHQNENTQFANRDLSDDVQLRR